MEAHRVRSASESTVSADRRLRLVLIGNSGVGKSAFLTQWVGEGFNRFLGATVGIDSRQKRVEIAGKIVSILIYDTAGQERFRSIAPAYCRRADGVILIYDIFDLASFNNIKFWREKAEDFAPEKVRFLLLGNKFDMQDSKSRVVTEEMGRAAAREMGVPFFEVSAKTGRNVDEALNSFVVDILTNKSEIEPNEEVITVTGAADTPTWKDKLRSYCTGSVPTSRVGTRNSY